MAFYFVEWIVLTLLMTPSESHKKYTKVRNIIGGIIYVFFASFRDVQINQYLDAYTYYTIFQKADNSFSSFLAISNVEPGYSFLAWVIKNLTDSYLIMLLVIHIFVYCSYIYFINNILLTKHKILPVSVLCLDLFSAYYIQRNIVAVSFGMIMLVLLYQKKYGKALWSLFLAVMFHYSSIILLPIYCFVWLLNRKKRLNKTRIVLLESAAVGFTVIAARFLGIYMGSSNKYYVYQNTGSVALATVFISVIILYIYFKRMHEYNVKYPATRVLGLALFIIILVIPLQMQYSIMYRMNLFFMPIICVMLMYLGEVYHARYWRFIFYMIAILYYFYKIYSFFSSELQYIGIPYKFLFG